MSNIVTRCLQLLVAAFLSVNETAAQHSIVRHYDVNDGLASNHVYECLQDHKGFVWFATDNGVSRFDGIAFRNFTTRDGLPDNDIVNIIEDHSGRIWLCCYNGILCYIYNNKVYTQESDPRLKLYVSDGYVRFCKTAKKLLLLPFSIHGKAIETSSGDSTFRNIPLTGALLSFQAGFLNIQYAFSGSLLLYNHQYQPIDKRRIFEWQGQTLIHSVCAWGKNKVAVFFKDSTCRRYDFSDGRIQQTDIIRMSFMVSELYNFKGRLWAQVNNYGVIPLDDRFRCDSTRPVLFAGKLIQDFMQDREGNYWGCSSGGGVYLALNKPLQVYDRDDGILGSNIQKLSSWKDELFLGYNNSNIQMLKAGKISDLKTNSAEGAQGKMSCLYGNGEYLFCGAVDRSFLLDRKSGALIRESKVHTMPSLKCIAAGSRGHIYTGTSSSCYTVQLPGRILDTIKCGRTTAVCEHSNGNVIIGTLNGLLFCRKQNEEWSIDTLKIKGLRKFSVSCIRESNNVLVVGTVQNGVLLLQGDRFEFVRKAGMPDNMNCKSVFVDREKNIWVVSFSGLYKIHPGKDIHHYTVEDVGKTMGLPATDINDVHILDDTVYVACSHQLFVFPAHSRRETTSGGPLVYINEFSVGDTPVSYQRGTTVRLGAGTRDLTFHFSAIDFRSLGNIRFQYRLRGWREDWQYTSANKVAFDKLPPGDYCLEIMAMNDQNTWSDWLAQAHFSIAPYWWEHKLAWTIAAILGAVLIFFICRWIFIRRHRQQIREASVKKQLAEMELTAIKAQINPHFIFNTLNGIQYMIADRQLDNAEMYLGKLGRMLRTTLDFSSRTLISLEEETEYIRNYLQLEALRYEGSLDFRIVQEISTAKDILIPAMVIQPYIENALKHAFRNMHHKHKRIDIRFVLEKNILNCTIEDNGIGREKARSAAVGEQHISKGLELSHSRLEMYALLTGKSFSTEIIDLQEEGEAKGTLIRITLEI